MESVGGIGGTIGVLSTPFRTACCAPCCSSHSNLTSSRIPLTLTTPRVFDSHFCCAKDVVIGETGRAILTAVTFFSQNKTDSGFFLS
jgi:hypothetical protein